MYINSNQNFIRNFFLIFAVILVLLSITALPGCVSEIDIISTMDGQDSIAYVNEKDRVYWYMNDHEGMVPEDAFKDFSEEYRSIMLESVKELYQSKKGN